MTRLTFSVFVLVFFFAPLQFVSAQALNPSTPTTPSYVPDFTNPPTQTTPSPLIPTNFSGGTATASGTAKPPAEETVSCNFLKPDIPGCLWLGLKTLVGVTIGQVFAFILVLTGYLFEISVSLSIANFGVWFASDGNKISLIDTAWGLMRDVVNIGVIFALLYISFQTIIGKGPELRKIIVSVVIFGLLTNFSLLFTKSLIDVSNIVALNFYSAIKGGQSIKPDFTTGVSAKIMDIAHMPRFFAAEAIGNSGSSAAINLVETSNSTTLVSMLLACIVTLIASFIFLQMSFLLLGRAFILYFTIIISPLMFAGPILFKFEGAIKKGWRDFFSELVSGPIFFILLWLVLFASKSIVNATIAFANTPTSGVVDTIQQSIIALIAQVVGFGIVAAGLQGVLALTKKYARVSGDFAIKNGSKALAYGLGRPLGYLGRQAGGRVGRYMQREGSLYQQAQEYLSKNKFSGARVVGNLLRNTSNIVKDSSYEIQNVGKTKIGSGVSQLLNYTGKLAGGANVTAGLDLGKAGEKGYEGRMEDADKKITESFQTLNKGVEKTGARKYDKFDNVVRYINEQGEEIVEERGKKSAKEWEDEVKKANKYVEEQNKKNNQAFIDSQRFENLNIIDKTNARITNVIKGGSSAADNQERAISAVEKEKNKKGKEGKNNKKNEEILKKYEESELEKQGLEEGVYSEDDIKAGKHKTDSETDEELFEAWNKIAGRKESKLKAMQSEHDKLHDKLAKDTNLTEDDRKKAISQSSSKLEELRQQINFAKSAKKQIPSLRKKMEEAKKKDEKKDEPKKEEQGSKK